MTRFDELGLRNRRAVPWSALPRETPEGFRDTIAGATQRGWRIVSLFGMPEDAAHTWLVAILAHDHKSELGATTTLVGSTYPSIGGGCPQALQFEREIAEQCGVVSDAPEGLKPLRRHPADHVHAGRAAAAVDREAYAFDRVEGDDVHEVAVGPVHAGIIEPGHFRFQAHGEEVLGLEIMLGYQHRGVERLLETLDRRRAPLVAESIAGDTVIGHANAYCGAIEAVARSRKTPRAQSIRGIALELERLANHVGDLGAIGGDVAFAPAAAFFGRLRGEFLNLLMTISGNRYGRGLARPGGVVFDVSPGLAAEIGDRVAQLRDELAPVGKLFFRSASVQARLEGVGVVPREACDRLGFVGLVARACEVLRDVRHDHPYGIFRFVQIPVATAWAGDVFARSLVRWVEVQRSLDFVQEQIRSLPRGVVQVPCGELKPNELSVAMEEGWRGEIAHVVVTDDRGHIRRHKVKDPSFSNWPALSLAMRGNQISDFPLCNKSFNLSYAGHDL
jgi:Ni,Fe-hydrogenase III large subunit